MSAENRSNRHLSSWILGVTVAYLATVSAASEPTQLPALEPVTIDVDIALLPASEKAALARIVHAGRLMDALYIRQVWPETAGLIKERESAQNPSAQSELAALNFFKGPWDNQGVPFIAGVPVGPRRSSMTIDSLGPQFVTGTTQPIADALQAKAGVAGQIRSMLLSLWGHRYLVEHGYLESRDGGAIYPAFLVPALDRVRGGLDRPRSQASTYILNHLIEAGAIQLDADGRFTIDVVRADAEVTRASGEFVSLMAKGDLVTIEALLSRYVTVSPDVAAVLKRIGTDPPPQRIVYRTADLLDPP
jgi:hypothetical protein